MKLRDCAALLALSTTVAADVIQMPVARNPAGTVRRRHPRLSKRASVTESLVNNVTQGGYYASVSIGTPGQDVTLVLDTGSSDAFVISSDADLCTERKLQIYYGTTCGATYDSADSSTYKDLIPGGFEIQYQDGSGAAGDYFTDDFTIGGKTVKNLQMGIANETSIGTGILGIGFELNEAAQTEYSNLAAAMVNQSIVGTMAYSLYLNDYYSSTGNILFGGIDTEKFVGNLVTVPILPDAETKNYSSFTVGVTGLSFADANGTTYTQSLSAEGGSMKSILDSGTTLSYLPSTIAEALFSAVGAYEYSGVGSSTTYALVDCSLDLNMTFRVNDGVSIVVPRDELVLNSVSFSGLGGTGIPFADPCLFGIQNMGSTEDDSGPFGDGGGGGGSASDSDYAILGDSFLRSAYAVYDLDNLQIGLAQANLNSTKTNVQTLEAGESGLPAVSGVASQSANVGSGDGSSDDGGSDSGSSSSSSGTSTFSSTSGTGTGTGTETETGTATGTDTNTGAAAASATATATSSGSGTSSSSSSSSSSTKSAAIGRGPPPLDGLLGVVGVTLAFAIFGSLLFWL